eukprot:7243853-Prymnesium_polylepis.1
MIIAAIFHKGPGRSGPPQPGSPGRVAAVAADNKARGRDANNGEAPTALAAPRSPGSASDGAARQGSGARPSARHGLKLLERGVRVFSY